MWHVNELPELTAIEGTSSSISEQCFVVLTGPEKPYTMVATLQADVDTVTGDTDVRWHPVSNPAVRLPITLTERWISVEELLSTPDELDLSSITIKDLCKADLPLVRTLMQVCKAILGE